MTTDDPNTVCSEDVAKRFARLEKAEVDARALADVRTLDAWAQANPKQIAFRTMLDGPDGLPWGCFGLSGGEMLSFYGATPDEARAKAAAWVRGLK